MLQLVDASDKALQTGAATDGNTCPSLTPRRPVRGPLLPEAVRYARDGVSEIFGYRLRVELSPP